MEFVHLHCHSGYSLLEGTATLQHLIGEAKKQGMKAIALTDRNNLYGAILFYIQAQKAGIKPIIGMEVDLDDGSSMVLLARNLDGYRNLCQLATVLRSNADPGSLEPPGYEEDEEAFFWEDGVWGVPVFGFTSRPNKQPTPRPEPALDKEPALPREMLLSGRHTRGLIALSGGKNGLINSLVRKGKIDQAARSIGTLITAFGEGNVFIELQLLDDEDAAALPALVNLANSTGVPVVATNDLLYMAPEDAPTAQALAGARKSFRRGQTNTYNMPLDWAAQNSIFGGTERYFKSGDDMTKLFAAYPQAIANSSYIADHCNVDLPLYKAVFPPIALGKNETPFARLWKRCFAGAIRHYPVLNEKIISRLKYEIEIIESLGFSPYFLVVHSIVRFAHSQGIPIIARGSVANSLVSYVLGISQVEPLEKDLLFERFLNPSRSEFEMPDIDLDICWRRRDEVLHFIHRTFGRDQVAMIGTHITFRERSAWREMSKVMGVSSGRQSYIANRLSHSFEDQAYQGDGSYEADAEEIQTPSIDFSPEQNNSNPPRFRDDKEHTAFKLAKAIEGLPRHAGMHCAGVVITPQPLANLVPLQRASRDPNMVITQYEKDAIEALGLVKMDLLGSRALTTLVDAIEASNLGEGNAGANLEKRFRAIPLDDKPTYNMMAQSQTLGCFQLESPGMRGLLKWLRPTNLDEVAIAISLFRPGPLEGGFLETFMRRHLGHDETTYSHPSMEPILRDTRGVILFQEQFLKLVNRLAGVPLGNAEMLRKALGKARSAAERTRLGDEFVAGAIERGIDQLQAQKVWEIVAGYSGFGFCAAHAHSYALVAYRSAYMKAHYPAEFLSAQINNGGGYYGPSVYVEEARRLHVKILTPSVNEGGLWCEVPGGAGNRRTIRIGMQFIKGLSQKTIEAIINERRNNGRFHSMVDLMSRVNIKPQEISALIKVGACDDLEDTNAAMPPIPSIVPVKGSMGETTEAMAVYATQEAGAALNRKQMMWLLPSLLSIQELSAKRMRSSRASFTRLMKAAGAEGRNLQFMLGEVLESQPLNAAVKVLGVAGSNQHIQVPDLPEYTLLEKLRLERETLGFVISCNEMDLINVPNTVVSSKLRHHADREVRIAGVIAAGRSHTGKDGNKMLFLSVQDKEGLIEVVVFSDAYKKYKELLTNNGYGPYIITGTAQVSGKGRGIGVQPPSDMLMADAVSIKMHPVVVASHIEVVSS